MGDQKGAQKAFTLIEMSIVLVIIGFIAAGVLVGSDLIDAANVRSQISQIEKYQSATNAFKLKFNALPGDISDPLASGFGLLARGTLPGQGDGNGIIEGYYAGCATKNTGVFENTGEATTFWVDLGAANLVDATLNTANPSATVFPSGTSLVSRYLPEAKMGRHHYLYVWSVGGNNYFGLSAVTWIGSGIGNSGTTMPVIYAYNIDTKIDDGLPMSGRVTTQYLDASSFGGSCGAGYGWVGAVDTSATAASSTTCYDNGNVLGVTQKYSTAQSKGSGTNCALSFKIN